MVDDRAPPAGPERFLADAEADLKQLAIETQQAEWVQATFITDDTTAMATRANARLIRETVRYAKASRRFPDSELAPELRRRLHLLRTSLTLVAPEEGSASSELSGLVNQMQSMYATARVPVAGRGEPLDLEQLRDLLATSRDPAELTTAWVGWHDTARPMRPKFTRYVELANRGAREIGFDDLGEMWRSRYDMPPDDLAREVERLWAELAPFYRELHAYVRQRLRAAYGPELVPERGPLPAQLLGNMWGQEWQYLLPVLLPGAPDEGDDLTKRLVAAGTTPQGMVEHGERFFTSLGLARLPESFWRRSMFVKPADREVVCHASAWDLDFGDDIRIKMCIAVQEEDFRTIHHELGHNYYQRAYAHLPYLYQDGANDGFHEAIGDTIALSVTPGYLRTIGLAGPDGSAPAAIPTLLKRALDRIAFLPFGLLIDVWRWKVFAGEIGPDRYNATWWEHKLRYQGIAPPVARSESDFDPGAKYHVASNVPYLRYFLAAVLQYQFHRGLARTIGWDGPLYDCSIYGRRDAGEKLGRLLALGQSRPWPEALATICGESRFDASAILEYYAPLRAWLREQNAGAPVGW